MESIEDKAPKDNIGQTPLHYAARRGHLDVVKYILENVEDKNPRDNNGKTPAQLAQDKNHLRVYHYYQFYLHSL